MIRRVRSFARLASGEQRLLLSAFFWLSVAKLGLSLGSFPALQRVLERCARSGSVQSNQVPRIIWAVTTAARHFPVACACLPQALAAQVMLGRRNHSAELKIGVAKMDPGKLEAHAWLECDGQVVLGGPDVSRYAQLRTPGAFKGQPQDGRLN